MQSVARGCRCCAPLSSCVSVGFLPPCFCEVKRKKNTTQDTVSQLRGKTWVHRGVDTASGLLGCQPYKLCSAPLPTSPRQKSPSQLVSLLNPLLLPCHAHPNARVLWPGSARGPVLLQQPHLRGKGQGHSRQHLLSYRTSSHSGVAFSWSNDLIRFLLLKGLTLCLVVV